VACHRYAIDIAPGSKVGDPVLNGDLKGTAQVKPTVQKQQAGFSWHWNLTNYFTECFQLNVLNVLAELNAIRFGSGQLPKQTAQIGAKVRKHFHFSIKSHAVFSRFMWNGCSAAGPSVLSPVRIEHVDRKCIQAVPWRAGWRKQGGSKTMGDDFRCFPLWDSEFRPKRRAREAGGSHAAWPQHRGVLRSIPGKRRCDLNSLVFCWEEASTRHDNPQLDGGLEHFLFSTSSTAQGGGGSFKNRKPIGEVGCCESGMAKRIHWLTKRCLRSPLCLSRSLTIYLPIYLLCIYLSI